jgi:signal transduction histidine kinase
VLKYIEIMASSPSQPHRERDVTRIILMTLFFLFHFMLTTQPPFRGEHGGRIPSDYSLMVALNIAIIGFWLVLEVFEFLAWNYKWKNLRYGVAITVLRCIPALALVVFYPGLMPGMMRLMAPLLTFYLSLVFRQAWSYVVVAFFWLVQLLLFFTAPSPAEPPKSDNSYGIVILLYQLMSILLMFLFALFWKEDRKNRERQAVLTAEIQANQEELKRYASRVSRVVALEERTRIARDIHDNLGHTLTAISIQLNKAEAFFRKDPEVSIKAIIDARTSMHEAMLDIRSTLDTLNNQAEGFDLLSQVQKPLESLRQAGISVISDIRGSTEGYNISVLLALYRFVQEGVTNILKHAGAHEVNLEIRMDGDQVYAELRDDGRGFDPQAMKKRNNDVSGYGLTGLTDRISLVRGTFSVESSPGKGTILRACMPKDPVALIGKERDDVARQ